MTVKNVDYALCAGANIWMDHNILKGQYKEKLISDLTREELLEVVELLGCEIQNYVDGHRQLDNSMIEYLHYRDALRYVSVLVECPTCKASNHTGVWDDRYGMFMVCLTCHDSGKVDEAKVRP